jgi:threonyl-tRNA synthetase
LTKEEALRLFAYNPFKVQLIANKIPDGGKVTAYRNGDLIDLCTGPHVPSTARVKAFKVMKNSSAYWLGKATNDSL